MRAGGKGLRRLAGLYGVVERMRSAELRMAADDVREIERSVSEEIARRTGDIAGTRVHLAQGAKEWRMAEITRGGFEVRMGRLLELKAEREGVLEEAVRTHRASLLRREQMVRVVERAEITEKVDESRRLQTATDDSFGALRAWRKQG